MPKVKSKAQPAGRTSIRATTPISVGTPAPSVRCSGMPRKLSQDFTKTHIFGMRIAGKPADVVKIKTLPREIAEALRTITKSKKENGINRAVVQIVKRGWLAEAKVKPLLISGLH